MGGLAAVTGATPSALHTRGATLGGVRMWVLIAAILMGVLGAAVAWWHCEEMDR